MIIYSDGSAHPNPGPGGFGVVVCDDNNNLITTYGRQFPDQKVTNNEMEIKSILYIMLNYGCKDCDWSRPPLVYSDSAYCVNIFNDWMFTWQRNGWTKSDHKPPENLKLIQAYYNWYMKGYRIELLKVKGHNGNKWNELADKIATGKEKPMTGGK